MTDPLDITLRALLERILAPKPANDDGWVNIRGERYPWKYIVASAELGECKVTRVGRKLMMRREELDRWLDARAIKPRGEEPVAPAALTEGDRVKATAKRLLAKAGL